MTDSVVHIQVDPTNAPSTPPWFGEVIVVAHALQRFGVLKATLVAGAVCPEEDGQV